MRHVYLPVILLAAMCIGCPAAHNLPTGWPDKTVTVPAAALNLQLQSQPKAKGADSRTLEAYTVFFDMPRGTADWGATESRLESVLRLKGYYLMDRQDNPDNKANFYASPDAQRHVILIMYKIEGGYALPQRFSLEMQVEHTKRPVQPSWKKL